MAYKPVAGAQMSAPNVVPMADIMLVLLIIFMVVTPMLQKGVSVDMAKVDNPRDMKDADKDDAIIVAVTRDDNIFLGNNKIAKEDITGQIKDLIANRLDKTIYVKSDGRAKYGTVVAVVDEIRSAGVDQIGLLTEKIKNTSRATLSPAAEAVELRLFRTSRWYRSFAELTGAPDPTRRGLLLANGNGGLTGELAMGMDVGSSSGGQWHRRISCRSSIFCWCSLLFSW